MRNSFDEDFASPADYDEGFVESDMARMERQQRRSKESSAKDVNVGKQFDVSKFDFNKQPDYDATQKALSAKMEPKNPEATDGFVPVTEPTPFDEKPEIEDIVIPRRHLAFAEDYKLSDQMLREQEEAEDRAFDRYLAEKESSQSAKIKETMAAAESIDANARAKQAQLDDEKDTP